MPHEGADTEDPVATVSQHEQELAALDVIEHQTVMRPTGRWHRPG